MKLRLNKLSRLYFGLALSFFFVNILFLPAQGERADDPGARECEFMKHRSAGTPGAHPTPAHALQQAGKTLRSDKVPLKGGTPKEPNTNCWMPLGPFAINVGDSYGAISGRVTGIAFGEMAPNGRPRVYAATANGGVWYSDNSGDSWHHFKNYLANAIDVEVEMPNVDLMSCGAIATSNNGNYIFVGTGEGSRYAADCQLAYDGYSYNGVGVLFSSDEGKSWKQEPSTPSLVGHAFFQLAVDPNDYNNVLGATTNGLYRRVADASSPPKYAWIRQDMGPEDNSVSSVVVAKDGNGKTVFYAARWGGGVFMSDDGGKKWKDAGIGFLKEWRFDTVSQADVNSMVAVLESKNADNINNEFIKYNAILGEKGQRILVKKISDSPAKYTITDPVLNHTFVMSTKPEEPFLSCPDYHVGRIELAVQPNNPNIVYAIAAGEEPTAGGLFGVYRLNRAGDKTWHPVKGDCIGVFGTYSGGGRGWWQMAFAVDPGNPNRLYMAGTNFYYYSLIVNSDWEISGKKKEVCDYWHMVHPDMHVLTYEPKADGTLDPDKLWNGNDGGLNYSGNATAAAPVFYSKNQGLPTILMEGFGQHPTNDAVIYAGTQDMAAVKYQCGGAWSIVGGSDCGTVLVNWAAPNKVIRTIIGGGMDCFIDDVRSYDATVPAVGGIPSAYGDQPTVLVYAPLAGTPYNKGTTSQADRIAFGSNKVWLNDQFGEQSEWKSIADMDVSGPDARIKALTFASYGKIYAGTMDGQVYRLTDTSSTKPWKKERLDKLGVPENDGGLPASHQVPITGIAIDPTDTTGNSIYITLGGMGDYRRVWRFDGATNKWGQRSGPNPVSWGPSKQRLRLFPSLTSLYPASLASFQDKLYAAAVDNQTHGVFLTASPDGKDWTANPKRLFDPLVTNNPVYLASLEEGAKKILAMTFVGVNGEIFITSSTDGDNWQAPVPIFVQKTTNHAVSIASFNGSFYLAYVGTDQNIYLSSSADAKTWRTPVMVKPPGVSETNAPVSLSVFKNQLFLTWNLGSVAYTTCSVDGKNWRSTGVGIMVTGITPPAW
ncbi:MAG: exo-alpha-sialidase [Lewinellaceae bacterium]|nr:exo-alpha-sialidase [Lewinellaceae bacterium]